MNTSMNICELIFSKIYVANLDLSWLRDMHSFLVVFTVADLQNFNLWTWIYVPKLYTRSIGLYTLGCTIAAQYTIRPLGLKTQMLVRY